MIAKKIKATVIVMIVSTLCVHYYLLVKLEHGSKEQQLAGKTDARSQEQLIRKDKTLANLKEDFPEWPHRVVSRASSMALLESVRDSRGEEAKRRFGGYQRVNDNVTFVYSGYNDDKDGVPLVRVIALIRKDTKHNFTCKLQYRDGKTITTTGVQQCYDCKISRLVDRLYCNGYIACPRPKGAGDPSFISVHKYGDISPSNNITVWYSQKRKNTLTWCCKAFIKNYSNLTELIVNIELSRAFGVDKIIIYLESQTNDVVRLLHEYEVEGLVELRNSTLSASPVQSFQEHYWSQVGMMHDCRLSQIGSAKYIIFHDWDEVIVPRKHTSLVDLADELMNTITRGKTTGAIQFYNEYYPLSASKTTVDFPLKQYAFRFNILPLTLTTRQITLSAGLAPKSMVVPEAVEEMDCHVVLKFKPGYGKQVVNVSLGFMHHFREVNTKPDDRYIQDLFMLKYSQLLVEAVLKRCRNRNC